MNKGFLMFSPNQGLTMLKDEPEDLTHLAPTAGDTCIPLENSPFDMFDEFMLNDNYCSLLGDDLTNGSPVDSLTPESLLLASSPEAHETESSCEPSLLTELSLDTFDSARSENDVEEGNSPFIPMNDERPVLEPAVMWGALPDSVSQARPQRSEVQSASPAPALQRLLAAPTTGPPPQDLITNIYSDQGLIPCSMPSWDTGLKRVLKQEEEPSAKRAKRSPSPPSPRPTPTSTQSSSVLMNLLPLEAAIQQQRAQQNKFIPNYQLLMVPQNVPQHTINKNNIPIPVINIQNLQNKQMLRPNTPTANIMRTNLNTNHMSPLSVNTNNPMYSLPPSPNTPNYSPIMSPAQRDRLISPYSTPQSMSPVGKFNQMYSPGSAIVSPAGIMHAGDPYLTNKMQPSPNFPFQPGDLLLDSSMPIPSSDFWEDTEMLQGTNELLTAFDDVKLG